jgi:hypothetical protein
LIATVEGINIHDIFLSTYFGDPKELTDRTMCVYIYPVFDAERGSGIHDREGKVAL